MTLEIVFGLLIGAVLGLLGAGGSIVAVPALVFGVGLPMAAAVPASLIVVGASSLAALAPRLREGAVRWRVALIFGGVGLPAAFAGAALGRLVPERWLMLAFAALMVVVAVRMLRGTPEAGGACRTPDNGVDWRRCLPASAGAGAVVGALTGVFGVGGGFLIVPALTLALGLTATEAVATSLVVIALNAVSGLAAHAGALPGLDYGAIGAFVGAAAVASLLAGRLAGRIPPAPLRRAFAVAVLAVAAGVAAAVFTAPELLAG